MKRNDHIIVTSTDCPDLFVWNTNTQPNRPYDDIHRNAAPNSADAVLAGFDGNADFALDTSADGLYVVSGSRDKRVMIWDVQSMLSKSANTRTNNQTKIHPSFQSELKHSKTHSDAAIGVCFNPVESARFASIGDDKKLLLWDTRHRNTAVQIVDAAHRESEICCIDWCGAPHNHLLATGGKDGSTTVWDIRMFSESCSSNNSPRLLDDCCRNLHPLDFEATCVQFGRLELDRPLLAASHYDGSVIIYDLSRSSNDGNNDTGLSSMVIRHCGHTGPIEDIHWHPTQPWTMASISSEEGGGSSLQVYRIHDFCFRSAEDIMSELRTAEIETTRSLSEAS